MEVIPQLEDYLNKEKMMFEEIVKEEKNTFYPVNENQIIKAEKKMEQKFPYELREFYKKVGYGFIASEQNAINRIIGPGGCANIRLREDYYEADPDLEMYEKYEEKCLLFFEINEGVYAAIKLGEEKKNKIYFAGEKIADSLVEFLINIKNSEYWIK